MCDSCFPSFRGEVHYGRLARAALAAGEAGDAQAVVAMDGRAPLHEVVESGSVCQQAAERWLSLWNDRDFAVVRSAYAPTCTVWAPSGRELFGHGEIIGWFVHLLGALPDARMRVEHVCAIPHGGGGYDVAIRWLLDGTHTGPSLHLPPTGCPIRILGVTHWRMAGGLVAEEWTVFDELEVLTQMYGAGCL